MDKLSRLSTEQRGDLVAYLDGELEEDATAAIEHVLAHSNVARNDVEMLARTYDLLDQLPHLAAPEKFARVFEMAGAELRKAADLDPDAANVRFFLGVSLLLTENTNDGIDQLSRTIALGDTPYLEEAYLYRARGHLGRTDVQAARRDLEVLIGLQGSQEAKARELLDALEGG